MHQTGFPGTSPWAWRTVSALVLIQVQRRGRVVSS
jgi:hypothetical protein